MIKCKDTGEQFKKYSDYISSKHWRLKREETFKIQGKFCISCGTTKNLCVHHLTYERIGNERITDLMVLCRNCHDAWHRVDKADKKQNKKKKVKKEKGKRK